MASNLLLAYSSYADAATLSTGSWSIALTNLLTDKLWQVARSTDATLASTKFAVDLGAAQALDCLMLGPGNFTKDVKYRIKAGTTSGVLNFDTGWVTPGYAASDVDTERLFNIIAIFASTQTYRYWSVELDDTANAASYLQIGRLFMPKALRPSVNFAPGGNGESWEDLTRRAETLSGAENNGRRRNRRVFNFQIPALDRAEVFTSVYQFERTVGFDKQVFLVPDITDTPPMMHARAFWGRVRAADPITEAAYSTAGFGLTISETF